MCAAKNNALETRSVEIWNVRKGGEMCFWRDETRTVSFKHPTSECCTCFDDDSGLEMSCEHYICPDCILRQTWVQIQHLKFEISCTKCPAIISIEDIMKFGLADCEEKQFIETAISVNFCESQDIQQCPNCQSYCQRKRSDTAQVQCTICAKKLNKSFEFCWFCLREWNNPVNYQICGNLNCKREEIQKLRNSPKKVFGDKKGKALSIPILRACPKCFTIIEHTEGCNEITCKVCKTAFCFICLARTREGSLVCRGRTYTNITCVPAPIQTKLRS
ncbi:E3 ubiquitin-protein ligase RNF19B-like [Oopsacas minuta]|uniref:RBR-type E3 ubiquitin transferase n=1 Tax=Oopsacas minuta TaxID=111878 RepID=A0AAV7JZG0_9METZ|nr:E3 ubiquitin-protein ligase RNF19B-like [Oopsacas minuta]